MANFIYVFGEEAYQKLMCLQYQLIKADTETTYIYF